MFLKREYYKSQRSITLPIIESEKELDFLIDYAKKLPLTIIEDNWTQLSARIDVAISKTFYFEIIRNRYEHNDIEVMGGQQRTIIENDLCLFLIDVINDDLIFCSIIKSTH